MGVNAAKVGLGEAEAVEFHVKGGVGTQSPVDAADLIFLEYECLNSPNKLPDWSALRRTWLG